MPPHPSIGVALITHCSKQHLPYCLPPYLQSALKPRVVVVNSSSGDGTVELAASMGAETLLVPRRSFNHGTTRERARHFLATDIVVMATPDAYPANNHMLDTLVEPLIQGQASVSYARQLPHDGAGLLESLPRLFNYPKISQLRSIHDLNTWGAYTFFCSDSCAAYTNSALDSIGGFSSVLTGEDQVAVAKLLFNDHKIAYVAEALVKHSHNYTLSQEFCRHFDTGLARSQHQEWFGKGRTDRKRGCALSLFVLHKVATQRPGLLPYALAQIAAKGLGYYLGRSAVNAPTWFKKALSSQDFYWSSDDFLNS